MADGSFAPIYTHIERELLLARDRVGYLALRALAHYADPFGWCYPGLRTLSELVGYAESSIDSKLQEFQQRGWIRIYDTFNARRRQWERDYQLSPDVIWIQDQFKEAAWAKWHDPSYILPSIQEMKQSVTQSPQPNRDSTELKQSVTKYVQPTPITNTSIYTEKPNTFNQLHKPPPPPNSPLKNGASALGAESEMPPNANGNGKSNGTSAANSQSAENSRQAKTETEKTPPGSAPPPQPLPPLEYFQTPLDDPDLETLAHILRDEFMTRLPQARRLVAGNNQALIRAGMEYVRNERRNVRRVKNPMGLLVWWLNHNAITYDDARHIEGQKDTNPYANMTWGDLANEDETDEHNPEST